MPPVDDPIARLHGRAAFAEALSSYFAVARPGFHVEPWPTLGGFEIGTSSKMHPLGILDAPRACSNCLLACWNCLLGVFRRAYFRDVTTFANTAVYCCVH